MQNKKFQIFFPFVLLFTMASYSQYTNREKNPFHQKYKDSLMAMDFNHTLPLLAKKGYKKGYDIPYAFGLSMAFYAQRQNVKINATKVGFNGSELIDFTEYITFGTIENRALAYTVRPDIWLLPFLNVYGIFGTGTSNTNVSIVRPVNFSTIQNFTVTSGGFGFTLAGGLGSVFLVVDNNFNWANLDALVEPVPAFNFDARIGHNFINPYRADRGISIWIGAFRQEIKSDTNGQISIKDLFPNGSIGLEDKFIAKLEEWATTLPPGQKVVANQIIDKIDDYFQTNDPGNTTIQYKLDKELAAAWNLIFGAQYQHNKHWQLRTEVGTFGKRSSFMLMLNYRFEGFKKNY